MTEKQAKQAALFAQKFANTYYYALRLEFDAVEGPDSWALVYKRPTAGGDKQAGYTIESKKDLKRTVEETVVKIVNEVIYKDGR